MLFRSEDVVKVTVIATGFESQSSETHYSIPAAAAYPTPAQHAAMSGLSGHMQLRSPAQQAIARTSTPGMSTPPPPPRNAIQPRTVLARPARGVESAPRHAVMPEPQPARAFGASAIHDEAVLDIPAYLRRSRS